MENEEQERALGIKNHSTCNIVPNVRQRWEMGLRMKEHEQHTKNPMRHRYDISCIFRLYAVWIRNQLKIIYCRLLAQVDSVAVSQFNLVFFILLFRYCWFTKHSKNGISIDVEKQLCSRSSSEYYKFVGFFFVCSFAFVHSNVFTFSYFWFTTHWNTNTSLLIVI